MSNCCELWLLAQGNGSWLRWGLGGGEAMAMMLCPWEKLYCNFCSFIDIKKAKE